MNGSPRTPSESAQRPNSVPIQSTALGNQLLNAKNARIKAENDRELLANRINHLRLEQDRVSKRIEETKKRALEIIDLKERNRVNADAKNQARGWLENELDRQKSHLVQMREERKHAIKLSQAALVQSKKEEVGARKEMRRQNESAVNHFRNIEQQRAINCRGVVRDQQRLAQERLSSSKEQQLALLRAQTHAKREQTERERIMREQEMLKMEKMEMELIKSLTQCQDEQKQAYEELEATLLGVPQSSRTADRVRMRTGGPSR